MKRPKRLSLLSSGPAPVANRRGGIPCPLRQPGKPIVRRNRLSPPCACKTCRRIADHPDPPIRSRGYQPTGASRRSRARSQAEQMERCVGGWCERRCGATPEICGSSAQGTRADPEHLIDTLRVLRRPFRGDIAVHQSRCHRCGTVHRARTTRGNLGSCAVDKLFRFGQVCPRGPGLFPAIPWNFGGHRALPRQCRQVPGGIPAPHAVAKSCRLIGTAVSFHQMTEMSLRIAVIGLEINHLVQISSAVTSSPAPGRHPCSSRLPAEVTSSSRHAEQCFSAARCLPRRPGRGPGQKRAVIYRQGRPQFSRGASAPSGSGPELVPAGSGVTGGRPRAVAP